MAASERVTTDDEIVVRDLKRDDCRAAGEVLARSHREDPAFGTVYRDPVVRLRALTLVFEQWCLDGVEHGRVDALRVCDRLAGVAVWFPPDSFPPTIGRQLRFAPGYLPVARVAPRSFPRLLRYGARAARLHPRGRKWYLAIVGLDDGFRGRGLGARLLERGLRRADDQELPCYLETAKRRNVDWYRWLGFFVSDPAVQLVPRGPTHWMMWRPPEAA
jgi:GNAT superfamily N-acetyltransferase